MPLHLSGTSTEPVNAAGLAGDGGRIGQKIVHPNVIRLRFPIPPKIALESLLWRLKGSVQDRGLVSHALSLTSLPTWLAAEVPISEPRQEERREEAPSACVPGEGGAW